MASITLDADTTDALLKRSALQLSFTGVGEDEAARPEASGFSISGRLTSDTLQIEKGADVTVTIVDRNGQVIAKADGYVNQVAFKETRPKDGPFFTERNHTIKLHQEDA